MLPPILSGLAILCLLAALLPAVTACVNLVLLRRGPGSRTPGPAHPPATGRSPPLVSILIPARDEAGTIAACVSAALASRDVAVEVVVGDDGSTDATPEIVSAVADPRLSLVSIPPLPAGWTGKNHACARLAERARGTALLFIDADVRLGPEAAATLLRHAAATGSALVSGVPRQRMASIGEMLTVPTINLLLLGYLPVALMRARRDPSLGAACGQLILVRQEAYRATGGHGAIRETLHDGVRLARMLRTAGYRTDLISATGLAECRMYGGLSQAWAGFSKNAHEGLATPRALPVWTILLGLAHVVPILIMIAASGGFVAPHTFWLATIAAGISFATRAVITAACREPIASIVLHPATVIVALSIQWAALLRRDRNGVAVWKGRAYALDRS